MTIFTFFSWNLKQPTNLPLSYHFSTYYVSDRLSSVVLPVSWTKTKTNISCIDAYMQLCTHYSIINLGSLIHLSSYVQQIKDILHGLWPNARSNLNQLIPCYTLKHHTRTYMPPYIYGMSVIEVLYCDRYKLQKRKIKAKMSTQICVN